MTFFSIVTSEETRASNHGLSVEFLLVVLPISNILGFDLGLWRAGTMITATGTMRVLRCASNELHMHYFLDARRLMKDLPETFKRSPIFVSF